MSLIKRIRNSKFIRSSATLMSGSLVAQLITVVSAIVLARIYTPDLMGVYTLVLTAESLFGGIMCLRYEVAIVTEKSEEKVFPIIKLCSIIVIFLSVCFSIGYGWVNFVNNPELSQHSYLIVFILIMLLSHGTINILEAYNNRRQEYKLMTSTYVLRTSVQNGGAILLGLLKCGIVGLVGAHTIGSLSGVNRQAKSVVKEKDKIISSSGNQVKNAALENKNLPLYSSPAVFANRYSYSSISLFINQLFGAAALGFYSISYKALGLPLTVLSNNMSKVFFKDATKEFHDNGNFKKTFNRTVVLLIIMSIPLGVIIYFAAPIFIKLLLGEKWLVAADYVRILLPMFLIRLVVNTIAYGLQIVNKQKFELLFQILLVLASVSAYFVVKGSGWGIADYLKVINYIFSIVYVIYFLSVMYYAYKGKGGSVSIESKD